MRTRVKICGITTEQDARLAVEAGADAIGLVFYDKSPRAVTPAQAVQILHALPAFVNVVGLFVDANEQWLGQVIDEVRIDTIQFHGQESVNACRLYDKPYIKAVRMRDDVDLEQICETYDDAAAILLDSYQAGTPGGTGTVFNWQSIPAKLPLPLILAGGLSPENISQAIQSVNPYAVDVSSGVEKNKGIKDAVKIRSFMRGVFNCQN